MTNAKQIDTFAAAQLAMSHADAMNLVSRGEYHPQTTPRKVLDTYLHWSKITGVKLHNQHWEDRAERVVQELNKKRGDAWKAYLRIA